jgi:SAM-dependent methyltransferase
MPEQSQIHADQVAYWNGEGGARWVARQAHTDVMLAPVADALIAHAAPQPTDRVLDIGCGCGATTLLLGSAVPHGMVTGLDVSAPMLAVAEARGGGLPNVTWLLADAATHRFDNGSFDLLFSRFGVMFFGDPIAAFRNLRRAAGRAGRLVFACWRTLAENPWMEVPLRAVEAHVPPLPPPEPHAPGPFAYADPDRVAAILTGAGWPQPDLRPLDVALDIAAGKGLDAAVEQATHVGGAARLLTGVSHAAQAAAQQAIRAALAPHVTREGRVMLPGAIWLVTSRLG